MTNYVVVPFEALSEDAQYGVLVDCVSRDGTDYGYQELTLDQKVNQLKQALTTKRALLVYDETLQAITAVSAEYFAAKKQASD